MGDSISSSANAVKDAFKDARDSIQTPYRKAVSPGLREEINRSAAVIMPVAYAGNALSVASYESGGDIQAGANQVAGDLGIGQTVTVADPNSNATDAAPTVADPQQKRKRQLAGRSGTLLTSGGTQGNGTNLGGAGARSTLLGL